MFVSIFLGLFDGEDFLLVIMISFFGGELFIGGSSLKALLGEPSSTNDLTLGATFFPESSYVSFLAGSISNSKFIY